MTTLPIQLSYDDTYEAYVIYQERRSRNLLFEAWQHSQRFVGSRVLMTRCFRRVDCHPRRFGHDADHCRFLVA